MRTSIFSLFIACTTLASGAWAANTVLCEIKVTGVRSAQGGVCQNLYTVEARSIYSTSEQSAQKLGSFRSYQEANQAVLAWAAEDICGDLKVDRSQACSSSSF